MGCADGIKVEAAGGCCDEGGEGYESSGWLAKS